MKELCFDKVKLKVFDTRNDMGREVAKEAALCMKEMLASQDEINCIFAAAPSQNEFLEALVEERGLAWERINAYHMDEYVGFDIGHPNSFNGFLSKAIFTKVPLKSIHLINGANEGNDEATRYGKLLDSVDVDITFMGIGENGHIAFNDPEVADFSDSETVKIVELDDMCRQQQVNDGCFPNMEAVPRRALTVTIPKLISAKVIFCMVPTKKKQAAVKASLTGTISTKCPASILRTVDGVHMYVDKECFWL